MKINKNLLVLLTIIILAFSIRLLGINQFVLLDEIMLLLSADALLLKCSLKDSEK